MPDLPERHEQQCNLCGGAMWLRHRKKDGKPFYSCGEWKNNGCQNIYNVPDDVAQANIKPAMQIVCPCCETTLNLLITVTPAGGGGTPKPATRTPKPQPAPVSDDYSEEMQDDIPF